MPNDVRDVFWDPSSNLVHALGRTQDGTADTIYVCKAATSRTTVFQQ